jgi:hypothetical protein
MGPGCVHRKTPLGIEPEKRTVLPEEKWVPIGELELGSMPELLAFLSEVLRWVRYGPEDHRKIQTIIDKPHENVVPVDVRGIGASLWVNRSREIHGRRSRLPDRSIMEA